jgi:translation initiation factor IF-2
MGHVDHGKTSLLDSIRSASVAAREAGGITQHIGAYSVTLADGRKITFIDTPGHAAFTSMRARGAQVTDIVILVVAADDGVMPQTIEAINHAKAAGVPIVVAVNKVDKPDAQPDRVKQQLTEHGLQPEEWGGETMFFGVSALKKTGIAELLEGVLLQAEVKELKSNPKRRARGTIIEARQDRGRGTVATVLVQSGTLRLGDIFVSGPESGRIRSMLDFNGAAVEEAGPSMPVEITGLSGVPSAGDDLMVVESESDAREIAANRAAKKLAKEQRALATGPISLEEFAKRAQNVAAAELNVILKADVHGSVEAVEASLEKLSTDKVKVRVLHAAVGGVNESDIQLAIASKAIVIGFGVRGEPRALQDAENIGVQVRFYRIIYELIDDVKKAMAGLLAPIKQEARLGRVEVRETFMVPKIGAIAGSYVVEGVVKRGANVRLVRDSRVIHEGKMSSLRRFKDDVREVQAGYECGIGIENYNDVKVGDIFEVYEIKEIAATLE